MNGKLLTRAEVAEMVGVSQNAIRTAAREHRLGYVKVGRQYLFREDDVDAWIESIRVPPRPRPPGPAWNVSPRSLAYHSRRRLP